MKLHRHLAAYRPDGQGGWEQITKPPTGGNAAATGRTSAWQDRSALSQWSKAQPSAASQQHFQALNNQYNARQMGAQRQRSFQMNRPAFRGGGRRR